MHIDMDAVAGWIVEAAEDEALPRFEKLKDEDIRTKAAGDIVTITDIAIEDRLTRRLEGAYPGTFVLGEEACEHNPDLFKTLERQDGYIWTIDPLDGTRNFAHGRPYFAHMIGLAKGAELLAGWIYDPVRGEMLMAQKGEGAYLNGERARIAAPPQDISRAKGTFHAGRFATTKMNKTAQSARKAVNSLRSMGSAGQEYLRLARGEADFTFFSKTLPWDHVPGFVTYHEAGGVGWLLNGSDYHAQDWKEEGILLAGDENLWNSLYSLLKREE